MISASVTSFLSAPLPPAPPLFLSMLMQIKKEFFRYYLSRKRSVLVALIGCGVFITFIRWLEERNERKRAQRRASFEALEKHEERKNHLITSRKIGVDAKFWTQLKIILPICIPGMALCCPDSYLPFL
jgi:hypothetical protein